MPAKRRTHTPPQQHEILQRAIVHQLLRQDHDERWSRAEIETELGDVSPLDLNDAFHHLREEGVLHLAGELVWASRATRHLETLEMIAI